MKPVVPLVIFLLILGLGANTSVAYSAERLDLNSTGKSRIVDLKWFPKDHRSESLAGKPVGRVAGHFLRKGWKLLYQDKEVQVSSNGRFTLDVPAAAYPAQFILKAKDEFGNVETQNFNLTLSAGAVGTDTATEPKKQSKYSIHVGVGYSGISFDQSRRDSLSVGLVTPKLAVTYWISDKFDLSLSSYYSAATVSTTAAAGIDTKFLGINGRVGYYPSFFKEPLRMGILFGFYYTTMMVTNDVFGFKNLAGPQLFPTIRYRLSPQHSLLGYFKFSPIAANFSILSLSNREVAYGLGYSFLRANGHSITFNLDASSLTLESTTTLINSNALTFGLGYGF